MLFRALVKVEDRVPNCFDCKQQLYRFNFGQFPHSATNFRGARRATMCESEVPAFRNFDESYVLRVVRRSLSV